MFNQITRCYYRPHSKDGEGTVFTGVCLSTGGGGTPIPGSFPGLWSQVLSRGLPESQVLSQVSGPRSFPGGYLSPRFFPRSLVPGPFQGGTQQKSQPGGTPERIEVPPLPSWDWGTPCPSEQVLATRRAVASCGHAGGLSC